MTILIKLLAFIAALGVLIVIHELGHFAVARLCGVKVLRFSVGFGRTLWSRVIGPDQTEWAIAALPLGGYVKMLDEREGEVAEAEVHRAFNRQSVWKRFAIVSAGPAANFVLAVVLYWLLFMGGVQEAKPILSAPPAGTTAATAGLQRGDVIRAVDEDAVTTWQDTRWRILQSAMERRPVRLEILNSRNELSWHKLDLSDFPVDKLEGDPLSRIGLQLFRPDVPPVIGKLAENDVAQKAGLLPGDRVLSADGHPIAVWEEVVAAVRARPGQNMTLEIDRAGKTLFVSLVPQAMEAGGGTDRRTGRIGAAPEISENAMRDLMTLARYDAVTSLRMAVTRTWDTAVFTLRMIGKMITGDVSLRNLSGPITIADYAGQSAQLGLAPYLSFLALISISLGVLNLLPIPLLDGGHLMYYMVEILKGSPVSERMISMGQRVGLTLLLFLMAFAFYNDINRVLTG
jgi:regulator of sigma E protease